MKKYLQTIFLLILTINAYSAPRWIYLDNELKYAKLTSYVEIKKYSNNRIFFANINTKKMSSAIVYQDYISGQKIKKYQTAYWPEIGDRVLIIINKKNVVSLFAKPQGIFYRFWSPENTMSLAMFYFKKPAIKLPNQKYWASSPEGHPDYEACWDGCLLPIGKLNSYKEQKNNWP
jgi:hypothetical protein